ncbi:hypothetical protein KAR91_05020 [Candidatus Pacearchaeota archaeon]|nr:hypothetical protein [Candidatus Pacearchaeota archaeon]
MDMPETTDHPKISDNKHISVGALTAFLTDELSELEAQLGECVELELLGRQKDGEDSTTKILVRTKRGHPAAVIVCSRTVAPGLVERGTKVAETIRAIIGEQLGQAIIRPLSHGYIDDRSYVMLPYCREFSSWKPIRVFQRLWLQRHILYWLRKSTETAAEKIELSKDSPASFISMLRYLEQQHFVDDDLQRAITRALDRIETGSWMPRHTIDHNDFWLGNVMLPVRTKSKKHLFPFVIIDWAGANPYGYGIYDLIRIARGLKLSDTALRREIDFHCTALQCKPEDTQGHLLATLARLHQNLECFPESRYLETFSICWMKLSKALRVEL